MRHYFIIGILSIGLVFSGCQQKEELEPQTPELEKITLDANTLTLTVGEEHTFTVTTEPEGIEDITLTWSSSSPDIASVNEGTVTANAEGTASITVSSEDIQASCTVNVVAETIEIENITTDPAEASIEIGEAITITAIVEPEGIDPELNWTSSDDAVATVDGNGTVTGIAAGNAVITVEAAGKQANCNITVKAIEAESISINMTSATLVAGESTTLTATVLPENTTDKTVTWTSSDSNIASIDGAGLLTAKSAGNAVITAETANGKTAECSVTVQAAPMIGDFLYTDGTWSTEQDGNKTIAGIIYYVGNIAADDDLLASEHPGCTHGLAVSLSELANISWQSGYQSYGNSVSSWVEANTSFGSILADGNGIEIPTGYRNTKAIEAFNADPENSGWQVEAVQNLTLFRETNAAPENTSGWYLPSAKELALLTFGEQDGSILDHASKEIMDRINTVLESIGAKQLGGIMSFIPGMYWSSSETDASNCHYMLTMNGSIQQTSKNEVYSIRPVLAF